VAFTYLSSFYNGEFGRATFLECARGEWVLVRKSAILVLLLFSLAGLAFVL